MSGISERNPFVGPRSIQQGEALYGRDVEVRELYNRLQARRIVVLHSPSGAGKSSLVQAGLIPRLIEGGYDVWKPIRVNLDPTGLEGVPDGTNRYLLSAMASLEDELPAERRRSPAQLAGLDLWDYIRNRPRRRGRSDQPAVLVLDQFEEVLTVAPLAVADKRAFFMALGRALDSEGCWALFVIREDHLAALAPYRDRIPTELSNTFRLDLLGLVGAREAAKNLAEQGGRTFPAVDKLVRDLSMVQVQQADGGFVAEPGLYVEPVQLQVVCRRLWDAMPADDLSIDPEDIEAYASVSSALGSYYGDAVRTIAGGDVAVERALRDWVGKKLIVGGIRSQVRQEAGNSAGLDNFLIRRLLGSYLVRVEQRGGAHWFELGHDRLVEPVLLDNQQWEQANLHPLQVQAKLWEDSRRSAALLLGAEALQDAQGWARDNPARLTEGEREFLAQSRELRARDRAARRRLVVLAAVAVAVAVVVGALGAVAWAAQRKAVKAEADAVAQRAEAETQRTEAETQRADAEVQRDVAREAETKAKIALDDAVVAREKAKAAEKVALTAKAENEKMLQDAFRVALRRFIEDLARDGSLSGEVEVSERWTPLREQGEQCFSAATVVGDGGRIVVAGHDAVLSVADRQGYSVFLAMTCEWLLGDQKDRRVVVLADKDRENQRRLKDLGRNLATLGYEHTINPPLDELAGANILILADRHQGFTDEESGAIKAFIARGGGVLAVGLGWAWMAHKPAKGQEPPTLADYPMNQLLEGFGARWNDKKIEGLEKAPEARVTLYEGTNFEGHSQSFGVGDHDVDTFRDIGDNKVSSVKVGPGLQVTLFENEKFTGNQEVLLDDETGLGYFNNLCSAIKVESRITGDVPRAKVAQPLLAKPEQVEVFENVNFTGAVQRYGIGQHRDLGSIDNKISSIRIPDGLHVTLYANSNFTGLAKVVQCDERVLSDFNDIVSGIEVRERGATDSVNSCLRNSKDRISFHAGTARLKLRSKPALDIIAKTLHDFPDVRFRISCHVDDSGPRFAQEELTQRRAATVKQYLVDSGVDSGRFVLWGAGSAQPLYSSETAAGRAGNERCELAIEQ